MKTPWQCEVQYNLRVALLGVLAEDSTQQPVCKHLLWGTSTPNRASCWLSIEPTLHPSGNDYFQLDGNGTSRSRQFRLKEQPNTWTDVLILQRRKHTEVIAEMHHEGLDLTSLEFF